MGIIKVLDKSVTDLIAAGEVVERPASVVKELIENSIDAGASSVTVETRGGGISYIRVTDNGKGMESDDVGVAFMRHATSKIAHAEDLEKIGTLGFRGEALCSIAAVARVTMTTKTKDAPVATRVWITGGEMEDVQEVGAPNGTTIEVENLFFNTPARMKFLKRDVTEGGYVADIVQKFVLVNPHISFRLLQNGKQILFSSGDSNPINAIYTVYGKDYAANVIPIDYGDKVVRAYGYIGKSQISRPNRACQSFFVNGRTIKSRTVTAALEEGFRNQLMVGKFPFAVICLDIAPAFIDVNVHPHKTEVKFSDEKKVFDTVYMAVKNALYQKPIVPEMTFAQKKNVYKTQTDTNAKSVVQTVLEEKSAPESVVRTLEVYKQTKEAPQLAEKRSVSFAEAPKSASFAESRTTAQTVQFRQPEPFSYTVEKPASPNPIVPDFSVPDEPATEERAELPETKETNFAADYRIVGQLFSTYIILEKDEQMFMLDQHAAHERIRYEQLKAQYDAHSIARQCLVEGAIVTLSQNEYAWAMQNATRLETLGFSFEEFGGTSVCLNTLPQQIDCDSAEDVFTQIIMQLMDNNKDVVSAQNLRALYTIACKSAIKANHALQETEIFALLEQVLAMRSVNTCPHGRPIMVSMSKYEIEKQFKRII